MLQWTLWNGYITLQIVMSFGTVITTVTLVLGIELNALYTIFHWNLITI